MTWFYLVFAVLLQSGDTPMTLAQPFMALSDCNAAGAAASSDLVNDPAVDRAAWLCLKIDFSTADPAPKPPFVKKDDL